MRVWLLKHLSQLVVLAGGAAIAVGVGYAVAWQWGVCVAGAELVAFGLLLVDVEGSPVKAPQAPVQRRMRKP